MKKRLGVFVMFALAGAFALSWGLVAAHSARGVILDYRVMDLGARCLLQHGDPYKEVDMLKVCESEEGQNETAASPQGRYLATLQIYPPTSELVFAPFALLPWPLAYRTWITVTFGLLVLGTFLMWDVAQSYAPDPPFFLGCIILANSGILLSGGNPAGVAVCLCVISFWCFYRKRFQWAGVVCLAISLAIKPHDGGLVWLYALMLGGAFRRQAVRALALMAVMGVGAFAWISQVAPGWAQEISANLATLSSPGSYNDPAAANAALILNLQAVIAVFRNKPEFYNLLAYVMCAPLLVWWAYVTFRVRHSSRAIWLGVAAISALSLLPVYHRAYDAKILLLCLPACAALWAERGRVAWMGISVTTAGILITSDLPVAMLSMIKPQNHSSYVLATRPAPLVLLVMSFFYLWAYHRLYKSEISGSVSALVASAGPSRG